MLKTHYFVHSRSDFIDLKEQGGFSGKRHLIFISSLDFEAKTTMIWSKFYFHFSRARSVEAQICPVAKVCCIMSMMQDVMLWGCDYAYF